MSYLSAAKDQALGIANKVINHLPRHDKAQTVTIACPVERVEQFWADPDQLSRVLGDIGDVTAVAPDRYRWRLRSGPEATWESKLVPQPVGVQFVGTADDNSLIVTYRPAPHDLGTEVTLHAKTPVPGLLSGAVAYKLLYRLRALLQTGELPTLRSNPSARASAR
ncbi:hypothetical protein [Mycobacterium simiae]|uniref:SRPBCC family protein n=1 Tax=Mycobacterium simiae TaxID=1784 RepID=A0A1X0YGD4_MYCSI|nr:hypothetical protein [Mycobacterium simiae]ORJ64017.1 hypothetical protein B5M45_01980 [Mycobacterium simiae]